jgi:glycosyltransferase involved in cell wall biosynthesis
MLALHRKRGTYIDDISRYIALTEFAKKKFVDCGLPAEKITVKPNFVHADPGVQSSTGKSAVFMGRLTPEKGVMTALKAWKLLPADMELKVIGDGPSLEELGQAARAMGLTNVSFLGKLPREDAFKYLARARFLLFPSEWYETFGMTIIEAYAHGVPVVASRMGVMPEIVKENVTGLLFEPRDPQSLAEVVQNLWHQTALIQQLGRNARREYETLYTTDENYRQLMAIYNEVLSRQPEKASSSAA